MPGRPQRQQGRHATRVNPLPEVPYTGSHYSYQGNATVPQFKRGRHNTNAARERSRVKTLRTAFLDLQMTLPGVPRDTKLSKLDVLLLATAYISHLRSSLGSGDTGGRVQIVGDSVKKQRESHLTRDRHPVKKWPMRSRLYEGIIESVQDRR